MPFCFGSEYSEVELRASIFSTPISRKGALLHIELQLLDLKIRWIIRTFLMAIIPSSNKREEVRKNGKKDEAGVQMFDLQSQLSLPQL